jgi:hypothetical protein
MKTMARRVNQLEKQFAPRLDDQGRSIADVIRERRRRRLAAEGREPEPELPRRREDYLDESGRPLSIAQIIINARARRIQRERERAALQENRGDR